MTVYNNEQVWKRLGVKTSVTKKTVAKMICTKKTSVKLSATKWPAMTRRYNNQRQNAVPKCMPTRSGGGYGLREPLYKSAWLF